MNLPQQKATIAIGVLLTLAKLADQVNCQDPEVTFEDNYEDVVGPDLDFEEIATTKYYFDKSMFIKAFVENDFSCMVATAPRGFGKSVNLKMLKSFFAMKVNDSGLAEEKSETKEMFRKLEIFKHQDIFNSFFSQYPVIHIDLKCEEIVGERGPEYQSIEYVYTQLKGALNRTYREHLYLLQSDRISSSSKEVIRQYAGLGKTKEISDGELRRGLLTLSEYLYEHFNRRSIVLIDSFDSAITTSILRRGIEPERTFTIVSGLITSVLKHNKKHVFRGFITGVYYIDPGLSDRTVFTFLDGTSGNYYGATEEEVKCILAKFEREGTPNIITADEVPAVYGGYCSKECGDKIYNIRSVTMFLRHRVFTAYWRFAESYEFTQFNPLIEKHTIIAKQIRELLLDETVGVSIPNAISIHHIAELKTLININPSSSITPSDADLFLSYLLQLGYLTYAEKCSDTSDVCMLKMPNKEVLIQFRMRSC